MQTNIVVWDPSGEYWEGSLIKDPVLATALRAHGAVLLPTTPHLFGEIPAGAFFKRAWGSGWPLDQQAHRAFSPMVIYGKAELTAAYWAARLVPDPSMLERFESGAERPQGQIQLVSHVPIGNIGRATISAAASVVKGPELGKLDEDGGWSIQGVASAAFPQDGYYSFALYGMMPGVRVEWAAMSLASAAE